MFLALELFVVAATLISGLHARRVGGPAGLRFFLGLLWLGALRETLVGAEGLLYRFSPTLLTAGKAPWIAVLIWPFSVYAAVVWAVLLGMGKPKRSSERAKSRGVSLYPASSARFAWRFDWPMSLAVGVFMIALAGFYEPLLERLGMARWEAGTERLAGVPLAAMVGYPTLAWLALAAWNWTEGHIEAERNRYGVFFALAPVLAAVHAMGLQALKSSLGW